MHRIGEPAGLVESRGAGYLVGRLGVPLAQLACFESLPDEQGGSADDDVPRPADEGQGQ